MPHGRIIPVCLALVACGGSDGAARDRAAQVAACTDAIERAGDAAPGEQVELVARGCTAACDGLAEWLAARAALRVRPRVVAVDPDRPPPPLPEACLAPGDAPADLASDEARVLAIVARWLDGALERGVADPQLPARVEHVTERAAFVLPLPAHPGLPVARYRSPPRGHRFVLVDDELRVGVTPHGRLRGGRVELVTVPGAYPGQAVAPDQLAASFEQHAELLRQQGTPPVGVPLVIARADLPLARVLGVVERLGTPTVELAVGGEATFAHPVVLERRGTAVANPELHLTAGAIALRGFGDDRTTDRDHLAGELDHFAAVNAPVRAIELHADATTTVADLALVLDACLQARISSVIYLPPAR